MKLTFRLKPGTLREWLVETIMDRVVVYAKLDSGSSMTLVGVDTAGKMGLNRDMIKSCACISFSGVSGKADMCAFRIPCKSLPIGSGRLECSYVYVPFEIVPGAKNKVSYRFITTSKYLIGTDILNRYNIDLRFSKGLAGDMAGSALLELADHGLRVSELTPKEYTLVELAARVEEINFAAAPSLTEVEGYVLRYIKVTGSAKLGENGVLTMEWEKRVGCTDMPTILQGLIDKGCIEKRDGDMYFITPKGARVSDQSVIL